MWFVHANLSIGRKTSVRTVDLHWGEWFNPSTDFNPIHNHVNAAPNQASLQTTSRPHHHATPKLNYCISLYSSQSYLWNKNQKRVALATKYLKKNFVHCLIQRISLSVLLRHGDLTSANVLTELSWLSKMQKVSYLVLSLVLLIKGTGSPDEYFL